MVTDANQKARMHTQFEPVSASLKDFVGSDYVKAVCTARAYFEGGDAKNLWRVADEKVDFFPEEFQRRLIDLLPRVGSPVISALKSSAGGATTVNFASSTDVSRAPVGGFGFFRVGEDGRVYLLLKSEHYHAPLGHGFPGYQLVDRARRLGIPNATHNNTRGHITRLLEEELVRTVMGITRGDRESVRSVIDSTRPGVLNRVLNLETGSLAVEAAIKMILARFYQIQEDAPPPKYQGRIPVILVIGDDEGSLQANYHGTTVIAQTMRGMWSELLAGWEQQGSLVVRAIPPNNADALKLAFRTYERRPHKIAGFLHEIIMMNYGAKQLTKTFLRQAYALCGKHDVPTVVDEIQSCLWAPELYLFREYGLKPTFVAVGKGFPGGEYPASRIVFSARMDSLPQFGALVTNGQEELASLAYLITMRWAEANAPVTQAVGEYYHQRLQDMAQKHSGVVAGIEGTRHLSSICFNDLEAAKAFANTLKHAGLDISVQTYKTICPPSALTKLPLIAGYEVVDFVVTMMDDALRELSG